MDADPSDDRCWHGIVLRPIWDGARTQEKNSVHDGLGTHLTQRSNQMVTQQMITAVETSLTLDRWACERENKTASERQPVIENASVIERPITRRVPC